LKSITEQIADLREVATKHGLADRANEIILTEAGKNLEGKLTQLAALTAPFVSNLNESAGKEAVKNAAMKAFGMTEAQARKFADLDPYPSTDNVWAESAKRGGN
jgi:hypothetical protein